MIRTQEWADAPVAAIRSVSAADMGALSDFFAGLSLQTRYLRFFAPVTVGPELLRRMSGGDGRTDAVVAVRGGVIIGHAMAADHVGPRGARTADVGVVVADAWQGLGLGSALMRALITGARARGVTSLTMEVLPGNRRMLAIIAGHWPAARIEDSTDFITFRGRLPRCWQQRPQARHAALASAG
ncbi:MAG TPA: GNAT family N-acetyltransferase [Streptosporangiaceae bacterium]